MMLQGVMLPQVAHYKNLEEWAYALVAVLKDAQDKESYMPGQYASLVNPADFQRQVSVPSPLIIKPSDASPQVSAEVVGNQLRFSASGKSFSIDLTRGAGKIQISNSDLPHMNAYRGVGWETLVNGQKYGPLGSFLFQNGGWYAGGSPGGSGVVVHVPRTGRYLIIAQCYHSWSSAGRLTLYGSVTGALAMLQNSNTSTTSGDATQAAMVVRTLQQNEFLAWQIDVGNVNVYTGSNHTFCEAYWIGD